MTTSTTNQPVDLAVVVALQEEFRELLDLFGSYTAHTDPDLVSYHFDRGSYRCVATFVGDMGEAGATSATERLIALWKPGSIVVAGITGGIHDDLRVGDVYVPAQAVQYLQDGKAKPKKPAAKRTGKPAKKTKRAPADPDDFTISPGAPAYRPDHSLLAAVRHFEFTCKPGFARWSADGEADLEVLVRSAQKRKRLVREDLIRAVPRIVAIGDLATGPVVGAAPGFSAAIQAHNRNIKGIEMESAAVLRAAQTRGEPVRALAIRGISDYGDARKEELDKIGEGALRKYAMRNAVRLLCALLDAEALPRSPR